MEVISNIKNKTNINLLKKTHNLSDNNNSNNNKQNNLKYNCDKHYANNLYCIFLYYYFRHRLNSINKISKNDTKVKKTIDKLNNKGKIKSKINIKNVKNNFYLTKDIEKRKINSNKENLIISNNSIEKNTNTKHIKIRSGSLSTNKLFKNLNNQNKNILNNKNSSNLISNLNNKDKKYFKVIGEYPDVKNSLLSRGYIEVVEPDLNTHSSNDKENKILKENRTYNFDNINFIFTLYGKDVKPETLDSFQLVNHYKKTASITRKVELMRNIRNLVYRGIDVDSFFPRCYDLSEKVDFEDFLDDYKITKCLSNLKIFANEYINKKYSANNPEDKVSLEYFHKIEISYKVLENRINIIDNILQKNKPEEVFDYIKIRSEIISDSDWFIIANDEDLVYYKKEIESLKKLNKITRHCNLDAKTTKINSIFKLNLSLDEGVVRIIDLKHIFNLINALLFKAKSLYPQYDINGNMNIWILKPSGLSRGRGISCINQLKPTLKKIKDTSQYVIQKYIENPLIVNRRKFDIRQWVLVSTNNLNITTIWRFNEPYVRFGSEDYDTSDLTNLFSHLTNNSITKHNEIKSPKDINATDGKDITFNKNEEFEFKKNMWNKDDFINYLDKHYEKDIWIKKLQSKIDNILILTIECSKDILELRKNSYEIYGFDLMIDNDFNVWLIEVNSSPDCTYSTPVTEKIVKIGLSDFLKVVIDKNSTNYKDYKESEIIEGSYKLIHILSNNDYNLTPNKKLELKLPLT